MPYDFLEIYYPAADELSADRIREIRSLLELRIREVAGDVDTAPNSVFGDLFLTPAAVQMAGVEEAGNRLLSDLDPENVAAGIAYNCAFISQYLKTFGIYKETDQNSYGVIRLQFVDTVPRTIDQSTTFRIGEGLYNPFPPFAGPVHIYAPGVTGVPGQNNHNYHPYDTDAWVVDLLVIGTTGVTSSAGTTAEVDRVVEGLSAAVTLTDFRGGQSPTRLQELARQVMYNFYSVTPVNRGGAVNMVTQRFPEIKAVAATVSGDSEMARDMANVGQVAAGKLDLLVRSDVLLADAVVVELSSTQRGAEERVYSGWLDLPETPIRINGISFDGAPVAFDLYSVSTDPMKPGLSAAYGRAEKLLIAIPESFDAAGNPVIRPTVSGGTTKARFTVSYEFDPNLKVVQDMVTGEDSVPVGLDLYTRWFVPMEVTKLKVDFNRRAGAVLNLTAAREDILKAYNTHTIDNPATPAIIVDALVYANAHSVNTVGMSGLVRYSVAGWVWCGSGFQLPADLDGWTTFLAGCQPVPITEVLSAYEPDIDFVDIYAGTYAASGERNVSWLMKSENLELIERRSV